MRRPGFATLLASTVVGVYVLVVVGATAGLADAAAACGGWPLCAGATPATPAVAAVLLHRAAAGVVGLLVAVTALVGWRGSRRRVRAALAVAVLLYPVQVAVGAAVAGGLAVAGLHLAVGMAIFGALVVALAWHLEAETGGVEVTKGGAEVPSVAPGETAAPRADPTAEDGADRAVPQTGPARLRATAGAYLSLTKPRLMWLLCLVAGAGMVLAGTPSVRTVALTLGGGVLAIGASGTFNHVLERDVDRRMARTADRPVATHEIPVGNALAFGGALAVASLAAFLAVNLLVAALGLAAIVFYSVVYTLVLKPNTVQNTVVGGAAGALPAVIGYAAVADAVGTAGLLLAGVIFLWTPAHFYNLALAYREDYASAGVPMLPVVRGEAETRKHVLLYLGATLLGAAALAARADLGWLYGATAVVLGATFLWAVIRLHRERTERAAFRSFHASNAFLGLLLAAIVVESLAA